jgi:MoaA/NifB/PqqE/SkfB family radical SAM enzyme
MLKEAIKNSKLWLFYRNKIIRPFFRRKVYTDSGEERYILKKYYDVYKLKHLIVTLTYHCQLHCEMCGQVETPEDAPNSQKNWTQIPLDVIKKRIDELEFPLQSAYLFGGEPLIYKDIFKLSEFLTSKNINFTYSTNGLLLKKYTNNILDNPPEMISVSMDGCTSDLHDSIRGLKGAWQKATDGIQSILDEKEKRDLKYPLLKIHFTIIPDNYTTMREFYRFYINKFPMIDEIKFHVPRFNDLKMGYEYFNTMRDQFDTYCLSYQGNFSEDTFVKDCKNKIDVKVLHDDITWLLKQKKVSYLGPINYDELYKFFKEPSYYPKTRRCECHKSCAIQPNGDVCACGDYPDLKFGNIQNDKIDHLWQSEIASKWRSYLKDNGNPGVLAKCSRLFDTIKSSNF